MALPWAASCLSLRGGKAPMITDSGCKASSVERLQTVFHPPLRRLGPCAARASLGSPSTGPIPPSSDGPRGGGSIAFDFRRCWSDRLLSARPVLSGRGDSWMRGVQKHVRRRIPTGGDRRGGHAAPPRENAPSVKLSQPRLSETSRETDAPVEGGRDLPATPPAECPQSRYRGACLLSAVLTLRPAGGRTSRLQALSQPFRAVPSWFVPEASVRIETPCVPHLREPCVRVPPWPCGWRRPVAR